MSTGILGIGVSGLNAALAGISTTEHNISNANTVGYRRQEVAYAASPPQYTGAGFFGTGVSIETVRSQYSRFLDSEVLLNQSQLSRNETYSSQAAQIDKLLGDSGSGLSTALDSFFAAANELANDPTSNAARQVLLSAGNNLAGRINTLDGKLRGYLAGANNEISAIAQQVNVLSGQIAQSNDAIARSEAMNGQPANDLRDQRDQLIAQLNKLANVSQLQQPDGSVNVFIGSGQALVVGNQAFTMGTAIDPNDSLLRVPTLDVAGSVLTLNSNLVTGGELGGVLALREQITLPAFNDLNRIALAVGMEVNRVHGNGLDYNLNPGGAFFTDPLAGAAGNAGALSITLANDLQLANKDYTLAFDGTDYTLSSNGTTLATDPSLAVVTAGLGFSLNVTTPAAAGDSWTISLGNYAKAMRMQLTATSQVAAAANNVNPGPGDNANALALAALQSSSILNNGTVTFASAYNQTISRTATRASESDLNRSAFTSLVAQSEAAQKQVSGVSLDEEAANLIRFQQAYQASAKAIQVASSLFSDLIGILA